MDILNSVEEMYNDAKDFLFGEEEEANAYDAEVKVYARPEVGYLNQINSVDESPNSQGISLFFNETGTTMGDNILLEYPIGIADPASKNSAPYMKIDVFKYKRVATTLSANRKMSNDPENRKYGVDTSILFSVCLPLPGNLSHNVSNSFTDYQKLLNAVNNLVTGDIPADVEAAIKSAIGYVGDLRAMDTGTLIGEIADVGSKSLISLIMGQGLKGGAMSALNQASLESGKTLNPMSEMKYTAPDLMSHQFDLTMIPTNIEEGSYIRKIIAGLRLASTGDTTLTSSDIVLEYPCIFNISFLTPPGTFIKGLPRIPDCYLTNFNVTYNPIGQVGRLMSDDSPTSYRMSMAFKNTKALTRSDLNLYDPWSDYNSTAGGRWAVKL